MDGLGALGNVVSDEGMNRLMDENGGTLEDGKNDGWYAE